MKRLSNFVIFVAALFVFGAVPRILNYQGKLMDSDGVAINDTVSMRFRLYASEEGGSPLWEEYIPGVEVKNGLFSLTLQGFPDSVDFSSQYWLEVEIDGATLSPRERLTSAPYSIRARSVERAIQSLRRRGSSITRTGTIILSESSGASITESGDSVFIFFGMSAGPFNYSLTITPPVDTVKAGFSAYPQLKLEIAGGEPESVTLSISGLPTGASATFLPPTCLPPCNSTLRITTSESTPSGTYSVTITGVSHGGLTKIATYTLTITPPFNYALTIDPDSQVLDQGDTAHAVVSASLITGFAENVAFSVSGLPTGAFATFSPTSCLLSCGSNMIISTSTTTPPGVYPVTISGMTSGGLVRSTTFRLTVEPFKFNLTVSPQSDTIAPGSSTSATLNNSLISLVTQRVVLQAPDLPTGINVVFNPDRCNPTCSSNLTISADTTVPTNNYTIPIVGTAIGGARDTVMYYLRVTRVPDMITNLTAISGPSPSSISLSWSAPFPGASPIIRYRIYRGTSPGGEVLVDSTTSTTFTFSGLTPGTTYYFRVAAVNSYGSGPLSNEASAEPSYYPSCKRIYDAGGSTGDGVYWIDPDSGSISNAFQAYCDMTNGGFTLIMKTDNSTTFYYSSPYWTTNNTLNATDLTLNPATVKYPAFNTVPFTTIRGCIGSATSNCLTHTFGSQISSALSLFSGGYRNEGPDRTAFQNTFNMRTQCNCGARGFNNTACSSGQVRVRWGAVGNQENDCNSCDTAIGWGIEWAGTSSYNGSCGGVQSCCCDGCCQNLPLGYTYKNSWLWVK